MTKTKFNKKYSNSVAIDTGILWYPLSEDVPTNIEIEQQFPLKAAVIENLSSQEIKLILDPISNTSTKEWQIPDGQTLTIENRDEITFHQIALLNNGDLEIGIDKIKVSVRNY